jgi:hypothetical protein
MSGARAIQLMEGWPNFGKLIVSRIPERTASG